MIFVRTFTLLYKFYEACDNNNKQECIPVGCVPAARRPYPGVCFLGGVYLPVGCTCPGGTCLGGVYLPRGYLPGGSVPARGVYLPGGTSGGCACPGGGVPGRGCTCWGVYLPGGCTCLGGCTCPGCTCPGGGTPPLVDRITDACKNITLAQLRCGR